jgi:hypothetical protein
MDRRPWKVSKACQKEIALIVINDPDYESLMAVFNKKLHHQK